MPKPTIQSKTGNAQIKKQGHTTDGAHGSDPNKQPRFGGKVRELNIK